MYREDDLARATGWNPEAADLQYFDWNYGVWQHRWLIVSSVCSRCGKTQEGVLVARTMVCLPCLTEYPNLPWHPTGAVVPSVRAFLTHAMSCDQHFSH